MTPITLPKMLKVGLLASPVIAGLLGIFAGYTSSTQPANAPGPSQQTHSSGSAEQAKTELTIILPPERTSPSSNDSVPTVSAWVTMLEGAAQLNRPQPTEPLTPPNWSFRGTIQNGNDSQVMIQIDRDPQLRFIRKGEKLPGGSQLLWARPDAIGVRTPHNKTIQIALHDSPSGPVQAPPTSGTSQRRP
jgi:hypothetical protein